MSKIESKLKNYLDEGEEINEKQDNLVSSAKEKMDQFGKSIDEFKKISKKLKDSEQKKHIQNITKSLIYIRMELDAFIQRLEGQM